VTSVTPLELLQDEALEELFLTGIWHDGVSGTVTSWLPRIVLVRRNGNAVEVPKAAIYALLEEPRATDHG
jgi:hypothetical protein